MVLETVISTITSISGNYDNILDLTRKLWQYIWFKLCSYLLVSQVTKLDNGLTVASIENCSPVSQVAVLVNAGSRFESRQDIGVTHLLRTGTGLVNFSFFFFEQRI